MARAPWAPAALYDAAARIAEDCLVHDGSLFTPGATVWTAGAATAVAERILINDPSKGAFLDKLRKQVADLGDPVIQFTAEFLFFQSLSTTDLLPATKREQVETVLSWMASPVTLPTELLPALESGVARFGAGWSQRPVHVRHLLLVVAALKGRPVDERRRIIADPWAFRDVAGSVTVTSAMQQAAVLHLVFPDTFEYVLAPSDRAALLRTFASLPGVDGEVDQDRAIAEVRRAIEGRTGRSLNFYAPWFRSAWKDASPPEWDELLRWAVRLENWPAFRDNERAYKLLIGERMAAARTALLSGDPAWQDALRAALGAPNNLTHWQWENQPLLAWCDGSPDEARAFLTALWADEGRQPIERVRDATGLLPTTVLRGAARTTVIALLLTGVDATACPPYRATVLDRYRHLIGGPPAPAVDGDGEDAAPEEDVDLPSGEASAYQEFIDDLDTLRVRLLAGGVDLPDRLEAQGLVWWLVKGEAPAEWAEEDRNAFVSFQSGPALPMTPAPAPERGIEEARSAWFVRGANVDGHSMIGEWLTDGFVSIGWREIGELSRDVSEAEIRTRLVDAFPERPDGWRRVALGVLDYFVRRIEVGDLVLTVDGDRVYVGRVGGDAVEDDTGRAGAYRRRPVAWLNADSPARRRELRESHPELHARLLAGQTVTRLPDARDVAALVTGVAPPEPPPLTLPEVSREMASGLHMDQEWIQREVVDLLREKKQLVFFGPPGTGKTLLAQRLAEDLTREGGAVSLVQFHPSYSYEDFFEGYRPVRVDGGVGITYELIPGPLRRIAQAAEEDPAHPYVLVIDEINRGSIPKIFGELLYLLEYRGARIPLQYSPDTEFGLPPNLFVIATMNTADRSIALVDAALRRRFYFVGFTPHEEPVRSVLRRWLERHGHDDEPALIADALNARLQKDELAIGPSYFITGDGRAPDLERIWRYAITPLLDEFFYGTGRDVIAEFGLAALRQDVPAASPSEEPPPEGQPSPAS